MAFKHFITFLLWAFNSFFTNTLLSKFCLQTAIIELNYRGVWARLHFPSLNSVCILIYTDARYRNS